jgi:hypothetical protein
MNSMVNNFVRFGARLVARLIRANGRRAKAQGQTGQRQEKNRFAEKSRHFSIPSFDSHFYIAYSY